MAAFCSTAARTSLTGVHLVSCRLLGQRLHTPTVCHLLRIHVSPSPGLWSFRTEPQGTSDQTQSPAGGGRDREALEAPEYIPRRKAKNPMMKIGFAWIIGLPMSIITFFLVKRQVDKNRLKNMKIRQRMKRANEGVYEGSRYHQHRSQTQSVKVV